MSDSLDVTLNCYINTESKFKVELTDVVTFDRLCLSYIGVLNIFGLDCWLQSCTYILLHRSWHSEHFYAAAHLPIHSHMQMARPKPNWVQCLAQAYCI